MAAGLAVAVVATAAAIGAEVAGIAPFSNSRAAASASTPTPADAGTPAAAPASSGSPIFPPPSGQWISQGTVVADQRTNEPAGTVLVRAWWFKQICRPASGCHIEFVSQVASGATNETELVPGSVYRGGPKKPWLAIRGSDASAPYYTATFPPIVSTCYSRAAPGKPEHVTREPDFLQFVLRRTPDGQQLLASSTESTTCAGLKNFIQDAWTATAVPQGTAPAIQISPQHAASARAFRASAISVCGRLDKQTLPIAAKLAADVSVLHSTARRIKAENAEASVATLLPKLTALTVDPYSEVPQPPVGPLDALWLRDVNLNRRGSGPTAALVTEIATAALAVRRFDLTRDPVAAQYARADLTLAFADARQVAALSATVAAIERQLALPAVCVTPPALASVYTAL